MNGKITLSQKKLNQAHVLPRLVNDTCFTIAEAAKATGLSERHTQRLKKAFKEEGVEALVHKNIGRIPANAVKEDLRKKIIALKQTKSFDKANLKFFQELIARPKYGICLSYSTLYGILTDAGIHSVKTKRTPNKHRTGKRKPHEGLMLQTDASPFDWLNTGEMFSLHGAIDDATSNVTVDEANEFLQSYIKDFNAQLAVPAEESIPTGSQRLP